MKKRWYLLSFFWVLVVQNFGVSVSDIFAQKQGAEAPEERERRHIIWLSPETSYTAGLDEGFSLFPRGGLGLGGSFGYDYRGQVVVNEFLLGGKYLWLDAPYKLRELDMGVQLKIVDRVLFPINFAQLPLVLYVGGSVHMDVNLWLPQDRLNFSYQNHLALDAMVRMEWEINKRHTVSGGVSLPILGVSWRPAWASYTTAIERSLTENGILGPLFFFPKFVSVHNLQSFTMNIRYTLNVSKLINLFADYNYLFLYDRSARPYIFIDNRLNLGMEFKL